MHRFSMTKLFRLALAATLCSSPAGPSLADGPRDIKAFVKDAFKAKIEGYQVRHLLPGVLLRIRGGNLLCHRDRSEDLCVIHKWMA